MHDEVIRPPARLAALLLATAVAGALAVAFAVDRAVRQERAELLGRAELAALNGLEERVGRRLEPALASADHDAIVAAAEEALASDTRLEGLRVRLPDGGLLALGQFHARARRRAVGPWELATRDPAGLAGTMSGLDAPSTLVAPVLAAVVAAFALVAFVLRSRLLRLAQLAHRLSGGRFDDLPRLGGRDEVGWIADTLRSLADVLREQVERVHDRNASLRRDVELQGDRIERLARFAAGLVAPVDERTGPEAAVEALAAEAEAGLALLFAPDAEGRLVCEAAAGLPLDAERRRSLEDPRILVGLEEVAARAHRPVAWSTLRADHPWMRAAGRQVPLCSVIAPLHFRGSLEGLVAVARREPATAADLAFLEDCSRPLAIAMANLRVFRARVELARALETRNDELLAQQDQLAAAARLRDQFVANMSHELRTPLGAILGYAELLADGIYGDLEAEQRAPLEGILETGRHLLDLVNQVLDLSRAEHDLIVEAREMDAFEVASEAVRMTSHLARGRHYVPTVTGSRVSITSDPERVRQILVNLVSNAIKFTRSGAVTVEVTALEDGAVALAVHDTGVGIDPAQFELVFQEFRQVDGSSTRTVDGAGLGLAIARRLARALGGDLGLRSRPGSGSTFTLTLPAVPPTRVSYLQPVEVQSSAVRSMGSPAGAPATPHPRSPHHPSGKAA